MPRKPTTKPPNVADQPKLRPGDRIPRSFFARATDTVARALIGQHLVRRVEGQWIGGRIVETEAYLPVGDLASHSARGLTRSNASMFCGPGTLYVYPIHAKHCLNAVTESEGVGAAVLIRAMEPIWGIVAMQATRGQQDHRRLTRGPAMICQALQIDRAQDGIDLCRDPDVRLLFSAEQRPTVRVTTRIGINKARELPLRFVAAGSRYNSGRME
ncbi:MAG: DNA-3-methyladenine glycosylase [Planctomycetota bacterium]